MSKSGRPPLEGIRVVDFSRVIAGPMCTQILSDMGAEVIKIENPDGGDDTRKGAGPRARRREPLLHDLQPRQEERGARLHQARRARRWWTKLLETADVLVQNFRPGVLKKYGFDYKSIHEKYPRLIYLSISAYGQTGPLSDRPGYDPVLQAELGMMSVNGEANGEGLRHAIAIVDTMTAIHSVAAINAALYARTSTGKGQHIDLALYDTALASLGNMGSYYLIGGEQPQRAGNGHFASAPNSSFETKNGKIYMAVANQKLFTDTCKALGHPEWATDPRFAALADRVANKPELTRMMEEVLKTDTKENWAQQAAPSAGRPDPHHEGGARRARGQAPRHAQDLQAQHGGRGADHRLELPLLRHAGRRHPPAAGAGRAYGSGAGRAGGAERSGDRGAEGEEGHRLGSLRTRGRLAARS